MLFSYSFNELEEYLNILVFFFTVFFFLLIVYKLVTDLYVWGLGRNTDADGLSAH